MVTPVTEEKTLENSNRSLWAAEIVAPTAVKTIQEVLGAALSRGAYFYMLDSDHLGGGSLLQMTIGDITNNNRILFPEIVSCTTHHLGKRFEDKGDITSLDSGCLDRTINIFGGAIVIPKIDSQVGNVLKWYLNPRATDKHPMPGFYVLGVYGIEDGNEDHEHFNETAMLLLAWRLGKITLDQAAEYAQRGHSNSFFMSGYEDGKWSLHERSDR